MITKLNARLYATLTVIIACAWVLWWFLNHSFLTIKPSLREAIVTVDNMPVWISPFYIGKMTITPGLHTVRVEADGYVSYVQQVDFGRAKSKTISVDLKQVPAPSLIAKNSQFLSKDKDFNTINYLDTGAQMLFKATLSLDEAGNIQTKNLLRLTDPRIKDIDKIVWSPDRQLALFKKKDGIYLFDFKKYDFLHQTETLWGTDIGDAAWAPDNSKIAYYYAPKEGERSLMFANIANTDKERVANLKDLNIVNPVLRWSPDSEWLLVIPRNSPDYNNDKIYAFNAYSRSFKQLTETGNQLDAIFSPDSNKIIYASYSQSSTNPIHSVLSVMDKDGSNQQSLNIRADISKVAWTNDSKTVFIAYYDEDKQRQSIYNFDISTRQKGSFAANALTGGNIDSILVSDDSKMVIYGSDNNIYALKAE